ncbi:MAG: amidase [Pirellula sp.]
MQSKLSRRSWLVRLSAIGIGGVTFQRALAHKAVQCPAVTIQMIEEAQWIADVELTDKEKEALMRQLQSQSDNERKLRQLEMDVDLPPASVFSPHFFAENLPEDVRANPVQPTDRVQDSTWYGLQPNDVGGVDWSNDNQVSQTSVVQQARAIRSGKTTSLRLTELYLARLKKFDPILRCVVTLTEELALHQAKQADQELATGKDRGLLHGIPWGAKDIMAVPPFRTTWGGKPFREQIRPDMATVVRKLNDAGAVMLGKFSVGTYALGDVWYDATTKNPWNVSQGSSGSSAGSASAVAAGLCTFALGSETLGSIVSPSMRCRVVGLRPSFGRVSRFGCMPLSWTMDKVGPLARYALDCGIVLEAIQGPDGKDASVVQRPLKWPSQFDIRTLRVGVTESELSPSEQIVLDKMKSDGAQIVPIKYPTGIPQQALMCGLDVESAAVFDKLFRNAESEEDFGRWGGSFRKSQFVRGIHYVQSLRARTMLIQETERVLRGVDIVLGSDDLLRTNLTGHPSMIVRCGTQEIETRNRGESEPKDTPDEPKKYGPRTIKLTAKFFADAMLVAVANYIEAAIPPTPILPPMFSE